MKLDDEQEEQIEARLDSALPPSTDRAGRASCTALPATTCASSSCASRRSISPAGGCCWTARTARPTGWRPRSSGAWARTWSRGRRARRPQHQCRLRLDARRGAGRAHGRRHDVGFAFDGDGDRVLAVDRNGAVVDGDELLALAALHLRGDGRLPGDGVAVTVMTNYGFHTAMAAAGIEVADHAGRRPLRARRAAPARLGAGWRAVRPHDRHRLRARRRRDRRSAAHARGARATPTSPSATPMREASPALINVRVRDRDAHRGRRLAVASGRAESQAARRTWPGARAGFGYRTAA